MKTISFQLPDSVDLTTKEVVTTLAAQLYEKGKLSLGQAAEMAGYSKRTFMELLADYGVSVFNSPSEDLDRDIENAQRYNS